VLPAPLYQILALDRPGAQKIRVLAVAVLVVEQVQVHPVLAHHERH
jgi:hypothetical protein